MRSNSYDLEKISGDPAYCLDILSSVNEDEFAKILEILAKPHSLNYYKGIAEIPFFMSNVVDIGPCSDVFTRYDAKNYSDINPQIARFFQILYDNLGYTGMIPKIVEQQNVKNRDILIISLAHQLCADKKFQEDFIQDELYRPFLKPNFLYKLRNAITSIDPQSKVLKQWDDIIKTPINTKIIDQEMKILYKFQGEMTSEEKDILEISKLFTDKESVFNQLEKLDRMLQAGLQSQTTLGSQYTHFNPQSPDKYKDNKFLSSILYKWAEDKKFLGTAKVSKNLFADEFLDILAKRFLIKDKATRGPYHGEWTHFLQWFILTEANNDKKFLNKSPSELLEWIGKNGLVDIWDITFEGTRKLRYGLYKPDFDIKSVQTLSELILSEEGKASFPLLHEVFSARANKNILNKNEPSVVLRKF